MGAGHPGVGELAEGPHVLDEGGFVKRVGPAASGLAVLVEEAAGALAELAVGEDAAHPWNEDITLRPAVQFKPGTRLTKGAKGVGTNSTWINWRVLLGGSWLKANYPNDDLMFENLDDILVHYEKLIYFFRGNGLCGCPRCG